jgi:uncharacterized membrane protein
MNVRLVAALAALLALAATGVSADPVETEAAVNSRGYALLRKGDIPGAIRVFQQNVEAHPESANVYDSLGEAYAEAGDTTRAVENYRKALEINPRSKSARYALERLTGERRPLRASVLFHISAGITGLVSGLAAMVLRKGSRRHAIAGRVFVVAILLMGGSGALIAFLDPLGETINVLMGLLVCYLAVTAWLTARGVGEVHWYDQAATFVVITLGFSFVMYGIKVARDGAPEGLPAAGYFVFALVPLLATVGDIRMIEGGGISGARRIVRHLWRMCTALFIAVGSFFLGQPQVFPDALRKSTGLRAIPVLLVIGALVYWLIRVKVTGRYGGPEPYRRNAAAFSG